MQMIFRWCQAFETSTTELNLHTDSTEVRIFLCKKQKNFWKKANPKTCSEPSSRRYISKYIIFSSDCQKNLAGKALKFDIFWNEFWISVILALVFSKWVHARETWPKGVIKEEIFQEAAQKYAHII